MIVVREGFIGTEAAGLKLVDLQKSGLGDFGKIVLRVVIRWQVIDGNGAPFRSVDYQRDRSIPLRSSALPHGRQR